MPTEVELTHNPGRVERWLRFGQPVDDRIVDRRRRVLSFKPGAVFAFVRWASNDHGTILSCIDILRAAASGQISTVPFVTPGAEILLRLSGWPKVSRAFEIVDAIEAARFDPADVCPDHWRHVHQRLSVGETPRAYTRERHRAWLLRQMVCEGSA